MVLWSAIRFSIGITIGVLIGILIEILPRTTNDRDVFEVIIRSIMRIVKRINFHGDNHSAYFSKTPSPTFCLLAC